MMLRRLDTPSRFELHMLALVLAEGARPEMLRPTLKAAVAPGSMLVPASSGPPRGGLACCRSLHSLEEEPEEAPTALQGMDRAGSFTGAPVARTSSAMVDSMSLGPRSGSLPLPNGLGGGGAIGTSSGTGRGAGTSSGGDGGAGGGSGGGGAGARGAGGSRVMGSGTSSVLVPQTDQVHAQYMHCCLLGASLVGSG